MWRKKGFSREDPTEVHDSWRSPHHFFCIVQMIENTIPTGASFAKTIRGPDDVVVIWSENCFFAFRIWIFGSKIKDFSLKYAGRNMVYYVTTVMSFKDCFIFNEWNWKARLITGYVTGLSLEFNEKDHLHCAPRPTSQASARSSYFLRFSY